EHAGTERKPPAHSLGRPALPLGHAPAPQPRQAAPAPSRQPSERHLVKAEHVSDLGSLLLVVGLIGVSVLHNDVVLLRPSESLLGHVTLTQGSANQPVVRL